MTWPFRFPTQRRAPYHPQQVQPGLQVDLGHRSTVGVAAPAIDNSGQNPFGSGFWVARFDPQSLPRIPFEIYRMAVTGPSGSQVKLYVDSMYKSGTSRAQLNEWDASQPIPVVPNQSVIVYWNTSSTPAPSMDIYLRTPTRGTS